jgi:hypothetical protein
MSESLSMSNCKYSQTKNSADLFVTEIPPPDYVTSKWGRLNDENLSKKVYFRTNVELCESKYFQALKRGNYRSSKGCANTDRYDQAGNFMKTAKKRGATFHPDHSRCHNVLAARACSDGSEAPSPVRDLDRRLHNYPFLVEARDAIISRSGMFAKTCGVFGLLAQCEAFNWGVMTARTVEENVKDCLPDQYDNGKCPFRRYDKVFILTQYDDTQIGQFILETMPKLIYHLEYLRAHPEIKIHYGFSKLAILPNYVLPNGYLDWLGFGDRLINGTVVAREVMMPREGGCQEPSYNGWELLHQREYFLKLANMSNDSPRVSSLSSSTVFNTYSNRRTVLIIKRTAGRFSQNLSDKKVRMWPEDVLKGLLKHFELKFPLHEVVVFSDNNSTLMTCPLCQVQAFAQADVVIGIHGAGLTNILYMKPGCVVVEVIPKYFDSRHAPAIGIFPRLAAMVGLHHYLYYLPELTYNAKKIVEDTAKFAQTVAQWTL